MLKNFYCDMNLNQTNAIDVGSRCYYVETGKHSTAIYKYKTQNCDTSTLRIKYTIYSTNKQTNKKDN